MKLKKTLVLVLSLMLAVCMLSSCGGKSDSKPADRSQDAPQNYSQGNADDFSVIDDSSDLPF